MQLFYVHQTVLCRISFLEALLMSSAWALSPSVVYTTAIVWDLDAPFAKFSNSRCLEIFFKMPSIFKRFLSRRETIGVRALSIYLFIYLFCGGGGGWAVTFLPEFTQFPNAWLLKSGYKRTWIARKTNSFAIYRVAGNFSWEYNFADFGFFRLRGKKESRIWISDLKRGNNFSQLSCTDYFSRPRQKFQQMYS